MSKKKQFVFPEISEGPPIPGKPTELAKMTGFTMLSDVVIMRYLINDYIIYVEAPKRLAAIRRQNGDASARPEDYHCHCPVPYRDALPDCWPNRHHCRFRHRIRPRPKFHDNRFGHDVTQQALREIVGGFAKLSLDEQTALVRNSIEFFHAEVRRAKRRQNEPKVEAAPLRPDWRTE